MAHNEKAVTDVSQEETEFNPGGQNGTDGRNGAGANVIGPSSFVFGENMESRVLKRPAEEQLDRQTSEQANEEEDALPEEPGEFPKASSSVISQRNILYTTSSSNKTEKDQDSRPSFKLNPPTLVHGKAKSAPMLSDPSDDTAVPPKSLLRPSPLCHATQSWSALNAEGRQRNPEDGSVEVTSSSAATVTGTPTSDGNQSDGSQSEASCAKPKTNYFIKLSSSEMSRDTGFGMFQNFSNPKGSFGASDGGSSTKENYFLQFAKVDSSSSNSSSTSSSKPEATESPKSLSNSGNSFVFGQKMNERVASPPSQEGQLQSAAEFQFGRNPNRTSPEATSSDKDSPGKSQESSTKSLVEIASEYEKAKKSNEVKFEAVASKTGEEDEENVFQAQCKLFVFDPEKHSWQERGRGLLRLNDLVPSSTEQASLQSRLVMRTHGSLRVVLNTKIWSGMTIEKATPKNIRLSARDEDSDSIRVFLVSASPKDAEQIYRAIEYRVQELKYTEQQNSPENDNEDEKEGVNESKEEAEESRCEEGRYEENRCEEARCEDDGCEEDRCEGDRCEEDRREEYRCEEGKCEEDRCEGGRCEEDSMATAETRTKMPPSLGPTGLTAVEAAAMPSGSTTTETTVAAVDATRDD